MSVESGQLRDHIDLMTSSRILADPSCAPEALEQFELFLRGHHEVDGINRLNLRPETALMLVRQDIRRCIQRVVAHCVAEVLAPVVLEMLEDDSNIMARLEDADIVNREEWDGARYRVFLGDEARIGAAYEHIFMSAVKDNLFSCFTPEQTEILRRANYDATIAVREAASETRDQEYSGIPEMNILRDTPYRSVGEAGHATIRMRTVSFLGNDTAPVRVNNGLRPDIMSQLHTNAVGFGEIYGSAVGRILPYTFKKDGCPREEWQRVELANLAPISALAALKDGPGGTLLMSDRGKRLYRSTENADHWNLKAVRQPLTAMAQKVEAAEASVLGKSGLMAQWGRCPSTQSLVPSTSDGECRTALVDRIDQLTGGRAPGHLRIIQTSADICAILGISLIAGLERRGVVRLDPSDLTPVLVREPN